MDLLSLLAKLTLDSSDYTKGLDAAQQAAESFIGPTAKPLTVDTKEFKDDIGEAEEKVTVFQQIVNGAWEGIKSGLKAAGLSAAIGKLVLDLGKAVKQTAQLGDEVDKGASKMGMSRKNYQEFSYALEKSGGSIKNLEMGLRNFDTVVGEGATDDQAAAFEKLGINAEKATDAEQLMLETLYAIADYDGADKGVLLRTFFGKNNDELNTLIKNGSAGIRELREEANDMGQVMSDKEIDNAIRYMDSIEVLQNTIESVKRDFAEAVLPVVTEAVQGLAKIVAFFGSLGKDNSLSGAFAESDKEFADQLLTIEGTGAAAEALADKLIEMGDTSKMTADQYAIWKGTAQELINMVPELGSVIDLETGQITANSEEIKENIRQWEALAKQKALQTAKEEKYAAIIEKNKEMITKSVEANQHLAEVEGARQDAVTKFNKVLERYGIEGINADATLDEIRSKRTSALSSFSGSEEEYAGFVSQTNDALGAIESADKAANQARIEAEKLNEELEKGKQEYEAWLEAAETMYGGLDSDAESATAQAKALKDTIDSLPSEKRILLDVESGRIQQYAIGSAYIPYDQLAYVHRGEQIVTATDTRQERSQGVVSGDLEDRIEAAIRRGMEGATVNSYINGRSVTDDVNRNTARQLKSRRFAP